MAKNILIVDSDPNFSTILKEGLNNHPSFEATVVHSGADAVRYLAHRGNVDLVIVDMAIADADPSKLVEAARELRPGMNVMVIPLIGQDVPDHIKALGVQGILPKPFFVGTLPKLVGEAIGLDLAEDVPDLPASQSTRSRQRPAPKPEPAPRTKVDTTAPAAVAAPPKLKSEPESTPAPATAPLPTTVAVPALPESRLRKLRQNEETIIDELRSLNGDVRAEVTLLTAGTELIAKAGNMKEARAQELAVLVAECAQSASRAAAFLGEREKHFAQSLHEGSQYKLFIYGLSDGIYLSLALDSKVTIGMLRHQARRTAQTLMKYID